MAGAVDFGYDAPVSAAERVPVRDIFFELPGQRFMCPRCQRVQAGGGQCPEDGGELIHDRTGQTLVDRYLYRRPLGRGAMGLVWEAEQLGLHRKVAIKLTPFLDEEANYRFTRGASIMSVMSHPHIATVHDFGDAPGPAGLELFAVMERLEGAPLSRFIAKGPLAPKKVVSALSQALMALDHVHRRGYVHRDIKPANLFVTALEDDPFFIKLLDFGIARQIDRVPDKVAESDESSPAAPVTSNVKRHLRVTQPMRILGTPEYMAPEQILGQPIDHRVDLYAVGVMAFSLLTGKLPLTGPHRHATYAAHLRSPPPRLAELVSGAEGAVLDLWDGWIHTALAKEPSARFPTASAMRQALLSLAVPESLEVIV